MERACERDRPITAAREFRAKGSRSARYVQHRMRRGVSRALAQPSQLGLDFNSVEKKGRERKVNRRRTVVKIVD